MNKRYLFPFILYLPFLFLFIVLILIFKLHSNTLVGDESHYILLANNIIQGFYSPAPPNIYLWHGPGYPLFLVPFVFFKIPLIFIRLSNAFFQYFSIVLLFFTLKKLVSFRKTIIISTSWALYYIAYQGLPLIHTETFTTFLLILFAFLFIKGIRESKFRYIFFSGLVFGYIALVKMLFGYVLLLALLVSMIHFLFDRRRWHIFSVFVIALFLNLPYLYYTHSLTQKFFYWGNAGGMSLYWMSSPHEGEFGDFNNGDFKGNSGLDPNFPDNSSYFIKNHKSDMDYVLSLPTSSWDDEFKKIAIRNIKANPVKYLRNCMSNVSRLLFGIPFSYFFQQEKTLIRIPPNSIIAVLMFFSMIPTFIYWKRITVALQYLFIISFIYLGLSTLVSAYPRQFYVLVPVLLLWIGYIIENNVIIKAKFLDSLTERIRNLFFSLL